MGKLGWFLAGAVVAQFVRIEVVQEKPKKKVYTVLPADPIPASTHKVVIV
jgi:hypothetical protein